MTSEDIFSITDLRTKPKLILKQSQKRPQFIFKNNKMVGVLISPEKYDTLFAEEREIVTLYEMDYDDLSDEAKEMYHKARSRDKSDFTYYTLEDL